MKRLTFFIFLISLGVASLRADDQMRNVQEQLKEQGFYYGQIDGQGGAETTAALRRYQIRNGLQVTGTLTQETLGSLKGAAGSAPPAAGNTALPPQPAPLEAQPQQAQPSEQSITQSDREFLNKQTQAARTPPPAPVDQSNVAPPPPPPSEVPPAEVQQEETPPLAQQYAVLFAHTPYANAPFRLQEETLKNVQYVLTRRQFYNGGIDGIPGPGTARAITIFQSNAGIAQTGRLDLDTLGALRLLPNRAPVVPRRVIYQPFYPPPRYYVQPRVYRGGWWD